jgi:O-antigen/teichoic acid export membrane protein
MLKNNFIYIMMSLAEKGIMFLLLPIYTAYLSPSDFGAMSLMSLLIMFFSNFTTSIITILTTRFYYHPDYNIKQLLFLAYILLIIKLLFFSFVLFAFNDYIAKNYIEESSLTYFVNLYILVFILSSFGKVFIQIFVMEKQVKFTAKVNTYKAITLFIVTSSLLFIGEGIYAIVYGLIASWSIQLLFLVPKISNHLETNFNFSILKEPLKYSYPLIVSAVSNSLIQLGDRYVIKIMLGVGSVGIYSFSYSMAAIISVLLVMPNKMAMQPIILAKEAEPDKLKYLLNRYAILYFVFGLIFVLWFSAFSKDLIYLISSNEEFAQGWMIIPIIAFAYLLHGLGNYFNFGMALVNKSYIVSLQTLLVAFTNIGLNFLLIPFFDMIGAALATMFSYILWNYLQRKNSKKYYGMNFDLKKFRMLFAVGSISICTIYILDYYSYNITFKILFLFIVSFILIYKFISVKDKIFFYRKIKEKNWKIKY